VNEEWKSFRGGGEGGGGYDMYRWSLTMFEYEYEQIRCTSNRTMQGGKGKRVGMRRITECLIRVQRSTTLLNSWEWFAFILNLIL
jgi:hypothetical protein